MIVPLIILLLITSLKCVSSQDGLTELIDIYSENITLEWKDLPISVCEISTTTSSSSTTSPIKTELPLYKCADETYMGLYCNITNDVCERYHPCYNEAICYSNGTIELQYSCACKTNEYSGYDCENDNRICKNNTCLNGGTCFIRNISITNETPYVCICPDGYTGTHCETLINMCFNITCENKGLCIPSLLSWSCHCLSPTLYSGTYCEDISTALAVKQILSKSFVSVAIAAITAVFIFVVTMDILKYVFKIDPVDRERQAMKKKQEKKQLEKKKKKHKSVKDLHEPSLKQCRLYPM
ncbi:unnamed protein product [Adineta steineri]|uniref:EGF-like domain-containing protein n=1 Tax=Adineta steineri TaxID=433720 RepID=A0A819T3Z9_9BILA|nr:unnamed protein product [Adineta steineri]